MIWINIFSILYFFNSFTFFGPITVVSEQVDQWGEECFQWILDDHLLFVNKIEGWRKWRLEDFYHLKLASRLEMITAWEEPICATVKLGLGKLIPEDKRGLDRFVSLKKRGGLAAWLSFYGVRGGRISRMAFKTLGGDVDFQRKDVQSY